MTYWGFGKSAPSANNETQHFAGVSPAKDAQFSVKSYVVIEKAALEVIAKLSEERVRYVQKTLDSSGAGAEVRYTDAAGNYVPDRGQFVPVT